MNPATARGFLRTHHHGVLGTFRADGRPQLSPVVVALDKVGRVVSSTTEDRAKCRNLRRDPRVTVCVFEDTFFGPWVQVEGKAELCPHDQALDDVALGGLFGALADERSDWEEFRASILAPGRVVVRFDVVRASGTGGS